MNTSDQISENENFAILNKFANESMVKTTKTKSTFIPAIFYWKSSRTFKIELNKLIPINLVNKYATEYANSIGFKYKLNDKKILLTFRTIPKSFEYNQSSSTLFLICFMVGAEKNIIKADEDDLELAFKIIQNEKVIKTGRLTIGNKDFLKYNSALTIFSNKNETISSGKEVSPKKFIKNFLDLYNERTKILSKVLIDKLVEKI